MTNKADVFMESELKTSHPNCHYYANNMDAIFLPEVDGFEDIKTMDI